MKKLPIFIFIAYIISLIESGFMTHFHFFNLTLLYIIFFNLLEDPKKNTGIMLATFCGFLFDIFSLSIMGIYTITFLVFSLLFKLILRKYVRLPILSKF